MPLQADKLEQAQWTLDKDQKCGILYSKKMGWIFLHSVLEATAEALDKEFCFFSSCNVRLSIGTNCENLE
jgi:hypothetical protein